MATIPAWLRNLNADSAQSSEGTLSVPFARKPELESLYAVAPATTGAQYATKSDKFSQSNYQNLLAELRQKGVPRANKFAKELAEFGLSTVSQLQPVHAGGKLNDLTSAFYDPVTNQYLSAKVGSSGNHLYYLRNVGGQTDFQVPEKTDSGIREFLTAATLAFGGGAALSALAGAGAAGGTAAGAGGTGSGVGGTAAGVGGTAAGTIPASAFGASQPALGSGIATGGGITGSIGGIPAVAGVQSGALAGTGLIGNAASGLGLAAVGQAPGYLSSLGLPETFGAESAFGPGATYESGSMASKLADLVKKAKPGGVSDVLQAATMLGGLSGGQSGQVSGGKLPAPVELNWSTPRTTDYQPVVPIGQDQGSMFEALIPYLVQGMMGQQTPWTPQPRQFGMF